MLVDYPASSSESDVPAQAKRRGGLKRKAAAVEPAHPEPRRPPPLPASFHSLYAANVRTSATDDPTLHAGRTRQVPHVVGNWSTHVYLEWCPFNTELSILDEVIKKAGPTDGTSPGPDHDGVHSFLRSDLGALLPLHISLSAPLVLKTDQKGDFQTSLETRIAQSHVGAFTIQISGLDWVANHEKTRFFLVLRLSKPANDELNHLLRTCNATARQFEVSQLYDDLPGESLDHLCHGEARKEAADKSDAFHISIAWTLEEPDEHAHARLLGLELDALRQLKVDFLLVKLKIGNSVIDIPLAKRGNVGEG